MANKELTDVEKQIKDRLKAKGWKLIVNEDDEFEARHESYMVALGPCESFNDLVLAINDFQKGLSEEEAGEAVEAEPVIISDCTSLAVIENSSVPFSEPNNALIVIDAEYEDIPNEPNATEEKKETYPVPHDEKFELEGGEFLPAPELEEIAHELISKYQSDFEFILNRNISLGYLWKRKGGETGNKLTFGKCVKLSGLAAHYNALINDGSAADFTIWIAADHTRGFFTEDMMRALVFHELKHVGVDSKGKPQLRGHDFEGFVREIEVFGAWLGDIEAIIRASRAIEYNDPIKQGDLFTQPKHEAETVSA